MLKQYRTLLNLFVLVLLVGCTQQAVTPVNSPTPVLTQVFTMTPTSEIVDDQISNVFTIQSFCPEIGNHASSLADLTGTMVMAGDEISFENEKISPNNGQASVLLFWNISSGERKTYQLPDSQEYYYYVTSPNKEKLALTEGKTLSVSYDVIVLNKDGEENGKFILPDDWNLFDWLNNEKLLIRQNRLQQDKNEVISVNPENAEQQTLPANFPNLYSKETLVVWGALTIFDPSASLVLYPQREENKLVPILWDVNNNKQIARIIGDYEPRWSPDGKQLLIVADYKPMDFDHEDIFLVKRDGNETRATFFKDHFERNFISFPRWSPNGRYVAFWLSTSMPIEAGKLAVLDTETSTVDVYCHELNPSRFDSETTTLSAMPTIKSILLLQFGRQTASIC